MAVKRLLSLFFLLGSSALFAANGSFTGQVVNGPNLDSNKKWVYVQASKGAVRRVEISHAKVLYGDDVPQKEREPKAEDGVHEGSQVRVTAEQNGEGEWEASRVEILKTAPQ
jgi:hypothetical protein